MEAWRAASVTADDGIIVLTVDRAFVRNAVREKRGRCDSELSPTLFAQGESAQTCFENPCGVTVFTVPY